MKKSKIQCHRRFIFKLSVIFCGYISECKNTHHGKLLLMAPSKDRAATLGFRCVVDAAE